MKLWWQTGFLICSGMIVACATNSNRITYAEVAAMRLRGQQESAALDVQPLRAPAVTALLAKVDVREHGGDLDAANRALDQALSVAPDDPLLIQRRAEIYLQLGRFGEAIRAARRSYAVGPRAGPICTRNWLTIAMAAEHQRNKALRTSAQRQRHDCTPTKRVSY